MRILIAIHGFPPTHYAGAERAGERIARWLVKQNHQVEVFAVEQVNSTDVRVETQSEDGLVVHRVYYNIQNGTESFKNSYNHPVLGKLLRERLEAGSFDIVHLISGYLLGGQVIGIAREFNIPVVVTLTEYWFMCARLNLLTADNVMCVGPESDMKCARCVLEDKRRYRLPGTYTPIAMDVFWKVAKRVGFTTEKTTLLGERRRILKETLEAADLVLCPSRFIREKFAEYGFNTQKFQILTHGLDNPPAIQRPSLDTKTDLRIGFLGQIKPHKGVDLAVEAVIELLNKGHRIELSIWGGKPPASTYVTELEERSAPFPSILWKGSYRRELLWDVLASMDIIIVPSRWYENSPTVILEAYKMGIPVIATNLGGMAELVKHEQNGLLFTLNDAADLSNQIKRLVTEPNLLTRLQAGIPHIKTEDDEVREIFMHYEQLAAAKISQ